MKKIVQIALCGSYNPKMGYQDNLLPKYYVDLGYECITIASQYYKENFKVIKSTSKYEFVDNYIKIIRLPYKYKLPYKFNRVIRAYKGLYKELISIKPSIIFLHNFQFSSIFSVIKFAKKHPNVPIYVDSHTDYINSANNWISKNILHKIIWRFVAKKISKYVKVFWGVTPLRCRFLNEVYKIPERKIDLLVMGADTKKINFDKKDNIRFNLRKKYGIDKDDFLIITGGKIDELKKVSIVIEALNNFKNTNIKLLIFGNVNPNYKNVFDSIPKEHNIIIAGWINADEVYDYFLSSDLGIFVGTHSVLWEQAIGTGLPCIFKKWDGMDHVDIGENCILLNNITVENVINIVSKIHSNKNFYNNLKLNAVKKGIKYFSYYKIAKKSIEHKE